MRSGVVHTQALFYKQVLTSIIIWTNICRNSILRNGESLPLYDKQVDGIYHDILMFSGANIQVYYNLIPIPPSEINLNME